MSAEVVKATRMSAEVVKATRMSAEVVNVSPQLPLPAIVTLLPVVTKQSESIEKRENVHRCVPT